MSVLTRLGLTAQAVAALLLLSGCQAFIDPRGTEHTVGGLVNNEASDRALSALTRGDFTVAERYALTALRYNPRDPVALLVAGMAYQGLGRHDLASEYYEVIITSQVAGTIMVPGDGGVVMPRSVMDVARANLAALDKITGRYVPNSAAHSGKPPGASAVGAPPLPFGNAPALTQGRPIIGAAADQPLTGAPSSAPMLSNQAEANVVGRFQALRRLLNEGLITPDEFKARRNANSGALLPYTGQAPSVGLDRPTPRQDALVSRLRALATALEGREITPTQQASERAAILDALLPDKPRKTELPFLAPRDMLEAGRAVGRVERMLGADLITKDEAAREKAAIEQKTAGAAEAKPVEGSMVGLRQGTPPPAKPAPVKKTAKSPGKWGVALASGADESEAQILWEGIKRKFPEELGKYNAVFRASEDGRRWRVVAGPLADKNAAAKLCKTLKLHRQSCDPASM